MFPYSMLIAFPEIPINNLNTSSDQKKSKIFLWKLITFYPNKQIWPNKLVNLKLSNHDNIQFVWA